MLKAVSPVGVAIRAVVPVIFTASATLDNSHLNTPLVYDSTAAGTLTLPASPWGGGVITVTCLGPGALTLARSGAQTIRALGLPSVTSVLVSRGMSCSLSFDDLDWWQIGGNAGTLNSAIAFTADITPPQITANQNDYAPAGLATASTLRLSTDGYRLLTGLTGGSAGRLMLVQNVGTHELRLVEESTSSAAANRFILGGASLLLRSGRSAILQYDATALRWRCLAVAPSAMTSGDSGQTFNVAPATATVQAVSLGQLNAPGSAPLFQCRAWVNFNGSVIAIRAGGNVSSITHNGAGDYTVSFTTAMPDANYAVQVTGNVGNADAAADRNNLYSGRPVDASNARVSSWDISNAAENAVVMSVCIFR